MSFTAVEIERQPQSWARAEELAPLLSDVLPRSGERVAVVGCGTSWFMAQAYARLREESGAGETDAHAASEMPRRTYDRLLAITRSGTTSEVLAVLRANAGRLPTAVITTSPTSPAAIAVDDVVALGFADERSVVQTLFATTCLALLRSHLGESLAEAIDEAREVLGEPPNERIAKASQFTFLGTGWASALAREAALKLREACLAWTEAYPAMEYRHGPISIAEPGRVVWCFGRPPSGLGAEVRAAGAEFVSHGGDPMADLVRVQRLALAIAERDGLNPDRPRHLTHSVVLPG